MVPILEMRKPALRLCASKIALLNALHALLLDVRAYDALLLAAPVPVFFRVAFVVRLFAHC
jgi:hypothetical protein